MLEYLSANTVANRVRLLQQAPNKQTALLLEGTTDALFWRNHIEYKSCTIVIANGKQHVLDAIEILEQDSRQGILGIVDADFDHLNNITYQHKNLLLTDSHDIETLALNSPALEKILYEKGSQTKIDTALSVQPIQNLLLGPALEIGYLRWLSINENLNLKFPEIFPKDLFDKDNLSIDLNQLVTSIKNHSQNQTLQNNVIIEKLNKLKDASHNPWDICCGHDIVNILSIALCRVLGSCNTNEAKCSDLESALRLAYEHNFLQETELYKQLKLWEQANKPYQILKH